MNTAFWGRGASPPVKKLTTRNTPPAVILAKARIQEKQFRFLGTRGVPAREKTHHPQHPSGRHACAGEHPGKMNTAFITLDASHK